MADHTIDVSVPYPAELSRGQLLLKTFFGWLYVGIPVAIIGIFYGIAISLITMIAWFAILFTGSYPRGLYDFIVNYMRWQTRVHAFMLLMTDEYPGFSGEK